MEGTNSQRAAPGYDAVAQPAECAPTSSCPAPSRHSHPIPVMSRTPPVIPA